MKTHEDPRQSERRLGLHAVFPSDPHRPPHLSSRQKTTRHPTRSSQVSFHSQSGEKGERPGSSRFFIWNTRLPPSPSPLTPNHTEPFDFSNTSANACIPRCAISLGPKLLVSAQLSFFFLGRGGGGLFPCFWGGSIF